MSDEEKDEAMGGKGNSKTKKKNAKKAEEVAIRERERELADEDRVPESVKDYERMIVASPDSSFVWIRYMAFQSTLSLFVQLAVVAL